MARWYGEECKTPDIQLVDNNPHSDGCGSSLSLEGIMLAATETNPFPPIPPDEPRDQMNLS